MLSKTILTAKKLEKHFSSADGTTVHAVNGVSFDVYEGETLAIVGESGCGKSTLGRMLLRLHEPTAGDVIYKGQSLLGLNSKQMRSLRKELQMIFQDPFASLNPRMTVYKTLAEPLKIHQGLRGHELDSAVYELLELVGLSTFHANSYPQEFSGGQRQRIAIARALASQPTLVVGDEPVSALDVSVQAQVINLLNQLKAKFGLTLVLISHDLSVIEHMADRVIVMYLGQIVEIGTTEEVFNHPKHPYTQALLSSIPHPVPGFKQLKTLHGELPNPKNLPEGCYFRSRCQYAGLRCEQEHPRCDIALDGEHKVACFQHQTVPDFIPVKLEELESPDYRKRQLIYRHFSDARLAAES
ncbi:ABC transporter ATP-binding protein [Vibrio porteresiae]|uniref:ATP-binding cassette domain-containing protein n=1 Tax=Vibrio porteresiae DSM 19223 TaxID=1123496 RepID=A0ABZ0QB56_9VIBR|nr:oligopeptide/dipeptide ABC transporter ATP-binding protein [Vibrio porteresiae]WPC72783.1 ATP-binding cassette domain-containing protein [Vibrio porteresiae DSM 19223]